MNDLAPELPLEPDTALQGVVKTSEEARAILRRKYDPQEWACFDEVAPRTGGGTRYADMVCFNLWQSRGHGIHGIEIKVSRSDWLTELKKPQKAEESVFSYCDFWFVAAPPGVVKDGELPLGWGHLELRRDRVVTKVAAPKLEAKALTRSFFASLVRRANDGLQRRARELVQSETEEMIKRSQERIEGEVKFRTRQFEELSANVRKFEEQTGLSMDRYYGPPIETVQLALRLEKLKGYGKEPLSRLTALAADMEKCVRAIREAVDESGLREEGSA